MYSENDLAKAALAIRRKAESFDITKSGIEQYGSVENFYRILAKAALDAQYLPASTPPSPGSTRCMAYRTVGDV